MRFFFLVCFFLLVCFYSFVFAKQRWSSRNPKQQVVQGTHKPSADRGALVLLFLFTSSFHFISILPGQDLPLARHSPIAERWHFYHLSMFVPLTWGTIPTKVSGVQEHTLSNLQLTHVEQVLPGWQGIDFLNSSAPAFPVLKPRVQQMQNFFGKLTACHNFNRVTGKGQGNF